MSNLKTEIESVLFVSVRPLTVRRLSDITGHPAPEIKAALEELFDEYAARKNSGITIARNGEEVQMTTAPEHAGLIQEFLKDETFGELTRPALETLTIVAYRGPISKVELEHIRGVNCSLILRNLMMRGLVEARQGENQLFYAATMEFVRHLGIRDFSELPNYEQLRNDEYLKQVLEGTKEQPNR